MGVFYMNGQAGYSRSYDEAYKYFNLSAHADDPFPMALHAMGNHFLYGHEAKVTRSTLRAPPLIY